MSYEQSEENYSNKVSKPVWDLNARGLDKSQMTHSIKEVVKSELGITIDETFSYQGKNTPIDGIDENGEKIKTTQWGNIRSRIISKRSKATSKVQNAHNAAVEYSRMMNKEQDEQKKKDKEVRDEKVKAIKAAARSRSPRGNSGVAWDKEIPAMQEIFQLYGKTFVGICEDRHPVTNKRMVGCICNLHPEEGVRPWYRFSLLYLIKPVSKD